MEALVGKYECEWANAVKDPEKRATFRHFANDAKGDDNVRFTTEREQPRPDDPPPSGVEPRRLPVLARQWVRVASVDDVPDDGGIAVRHGPAQVALFRLGGRSEYYATQNVCPHKKEMVLARGLVGDQAGAPKVACPLHKKTFDLKTGDCLSGDPLSIETFPVRVEGNDLWVELPPIADLEAACVATCG
jgi:nitrite reductase (NADH) large subunit